jgi:hypothetical protein
MPLHENWQKMSSELHRVIAQAWLEPDFAEKLKKEPKTTITEFTNGEVVFAKGERVEIDATTFSWRIVQAPDNPLEAVTVIPVPPKPADVTAEELKQWAKEDSGEFSRRFNASCC